MGSPQAKLRVEDDGLFCPEVGSWAETKYRLVALYSELFATGMKNKWGKRVYIDLYAGAGYSRIQGGTTILKSSPVLALTVHQPFDNYIFCERDKRAMGALKKRTARIAQGAHVNFVPGDCHSQIDAICSLIPKASIGSTVLSLCFVDPFDFSIKFETLRKLSAFYIDFLVLLAIGMDANRNYDHYVDGESTKIDEAMGGTGWRERWKEVGVRREDFRPFLAQEFAASMETLDYLPVPLHQMKQVRSSEKNLRLYYLALFSRNAVAFELWKEVLKYSTDQQSFFEE
jgi:three-Cys-motif partner protein